MCLFNPQTIAKLQNQTEKTAGVDDVCLFVVCVQIHFRKSLIQIGTVSFDSPNLLIVVFPPISLTCSVSPINKPIYRWQVERP